MTHDSEHYRAALKQLGLTDAAPDLLAALQKISTRTENALNDSHADYAFVLSRIFDCANKAIREATGG